MNVVLSSGKSLHVAFNQSSDGSSSYTTSDEEVQKALERHYRFGGLFRLAGEFAEASPAVPSARAAAPAPEAREVRVSDIAAAKDYLAERYGVSRTSLKSQKSIHEQAASLGLKFLIG